MVSLCGLEGYSVKGLKSLIKGGYLRDYIGDYYRGSKGGYWEFRLWLI